MIADLADLIAKLADLPGWDQEVAHSQADAILVEGLRRLGGEELADAYERARDDIVFWYA